MRREHASGPRSDPSACWAALRDQIELDARAQGLGDLAKSRNRGVRSRAFELRNLLLGDTGPRCELRLRQAGILARPAQCDSDRELGVDLDRRCAPAWGRSLRGAPVHQMSFKPTPQRFVRGSDSLRLGSRLSGATRGIGKLGRPLTAFAIKLDVVLHESSFR